ncbi:MAG: ASPIC/UnbV domain-containing protein [Candidatus Acidiferrales bacterium]
MEIRWPSGQVDKLENVAAGQTITVQEGKGQIAAAPHRK